MNQHDIEDQLDDLLADWELAKEDGRELSVEELCHGRPELAGPLRERISQLRATAWMLVDQASADGIPADPAAQNRETEHPESDLTAVEFVSSVVESGLLTDDQLNAMRTIAGDYPESASLLAVKLIENGLLTKYQADVILNRGNSPLLLDRYIILDAIGSGGMGIVFKALHNSMERIVAIKVLPEFAVNSPEKVARFQREVKSAAKLSHPNVVAAFDAHERNGTYFLVMEYVDGEDLRELVDRDGPLRVDDAITIIDQVAAGLGAAHDLGMVHRDVKPTNIMLTADRTAKLLDLGLARMTLLNQNPSEPELTKDGLGMGTASYMSPEQALDAKEADARSDIYSLGCTLYFLLTGKAPFVRNTTVQTIVAHREARAPSITDERDDVSSVLEAVYQRMVAKTPADRFQNVNELRGALNGLRPVDGFSSHRNVDAIGKSRVDDSRPEGLFASSTTSGFDRRHWLAAAVAVSAIAVSLAWWGRSGSGEQENLTLHRDIAKWAISSGGFATIKNDLGEHALESASDLPDGEFEVVGLELHADTDDFSIEPALKLPNLESLTLAGVTQIEGEKIASLKSLTDLSFYDCAVTDSDVKSLMSMKHLTSLAIQDCDVTDGAMVYVAQLPELVTLEIGGTAVTGDGIELLGPLTQLRSLDLTKLNIKSEDLRKVSVRIDDLSLPFCSVGDEVVEVLKRFKNLGRLDLQGTLVTEVGIEGLAALPKLTTLDLSDMKINVAGFRALKKLPALKDLTLKGIKLNEQKHEALSELENLESLDLSGSNLNDDGLLHLGPMKKLRVLYLEDTPTTETGINRLQRNRGDLTIYVDPEKA